LSEREQIQSRAVEDESVAEAVINSSKVDTAKADDLLDEIDAVLEKNAAEFIKGFVQKGGE
jgi:prokaryotic ubiquitin-like protein Pup